MRILIACEFSGIVRDAFQELGLGHEVWSCDLLPSEQRDGDHIIGDVINAIKRGCLSRDGKTHYPWDMMLAFPPCTHLAVSGARWWKDKKLLQLAAIQFVKALAFAPIQRIAIENPIGILSTAMCKPDQIIQPWQFGHGETKATCLWLKNLPKLVPTNIVTGRKARVHREPPSPERWKNRSRTLPGIAAAMAGQWGRLLPAPIAPASPVLDHETKEKP